MPLTGIETRIHAALDARLMALTLSPAVPIAWPNANYTPTGAYLRPWLLPIGVEPMTVSTDGANDYGGIYQVSVFWPVGGGLLAPLEAASAIAAHFKRGTSLTRDGVVVQMLTPPVVETPIQEPDIYHIPVSVRYRAFAPNL